MLYALPILVLSSCRELPRSFQVSKVEGRMRAAVLKFDKGWSMPAECPVLGACGPVAYGQPEWNEIVVSLECRCEVDGKSRYGQLVQNSYLINKATLVARPGGEDRRTAENRLQTGGNATSLAEYAQRDGGWQVARGTRFRYLGKYGQGPGLIQSESGNRFASLSYDAFSRQTYSLIPGPGQLFGFAHKGTFYVAVYDVASKQEIGVLATSYQGMPPENLRMDFYGENMLLRIFRPPFTDDQGLIVYWND
jgi:hypothetical protein